MPDPTQMLREASEAPAVCVKQIIGNRALIRDGVARLRALDAPFAATLARGSSDQAAAFGKFLFETRLGLPTLSHAPSTGALYGATSSHFRGVPLIAISQSGRSPDLLRAAEDAQRQGAVLVALVNDTASPMAQMADILIPLMAGPETSVAATKSFIASLCALLQITAQWSEDVELTGAVDSLGDSLAQAWELDWTAAAAELSDAGSPLVLGRGPTLAIAGEAALKFKETAGLHAEAFSIAEVAHGPMTLVGKQDRVLVLAPLDVARAGLKERIADFTARGACVIATGAKEDVSGASLVLPGLEGAHPLVSPIAQIQSFYRLANRLALARGRNPDEPPHLAKVTRTL